MHKKDLDLALVLFGEVRTQARNRRLKNFIKYYVDHIYQTTWVGDTKVPWIEEKQVQEKYKLKSIDKLEASSNYASYSHILAEACKHALIHQQTQGQGLEPQMFLVTRPDVVIYDDKRLYRCIKVASASMENQNKAQIFCGVYLHSHLSSKLRDNFRGQDVLFVTNSIGLEKLVNFNRTNYNGNDFENSFIAFCEDERISVEYLNFLGNRDFNIIRESRRSSYASDFVWLVSQTFKFARSTLRLFFAKSR